jgi:hypothetical protein
VNQWSVCHHSLFGGSFGFLQGVRKAWAILVTSTGGKAPVADTSLRAESPKKEKGGSEDPPRFAVQAHHFVPLGILACGLNVVGGERTRPGTLPREKSRDRYFCPSYQLHPLVPPQVLHFMQVPLRTSV